MMTTEKYDLNWHTFTDHLVDKYKQLFSTKVFADVTLVCDGNQQLKAHKIVLGSCSKIFQQILESHPQKHPVIYLKDISYQDMESLLQFMYLGKASFYEERMNQFLSAAKSFEVKEISEGYEVPHNETEIVDNIETSPEPQLMETTEGENVIVDQHFYQLEKNITTKMFTCPECDKESNHSEHMRRHIKSMHPHVNVKAKSYKCPHCDKTSHDSSNLKRHIQSVHEQSKTKCVHCGKEFALATLNHHKEVYHKEGEYHCNYQNCSEILITKHNLEKHIEVTHRRGERYKCHIGDCDKDFKEHKPLTEHIISVHNNERFYCDELNCDYQAVSSQQVIHHMRVVYEGIRKKCEKVFADRSGLKSHIESFHEGIRKKCNLCEKVFANRSGLNYHIESFHEGIRKKCHLCEKVFVNQSGLKSHIESFHEGIRYPCPECGQKFRNKQSIKVHYQSYHAGEKY